MAVLVNEVRGKQGEGAGAGAEAAPGGSATQVAPRSRLVNTTDFGRSRVTSVVDLPAYNKIFVFVRSGALPFPIQTPHEANGFPELNPTEVRWQRTGLEFRHVSTRYFLEYYEAFTNSSAQTPFSAAKTVPRTHLRKGQKRADPGCLPPNGPCVDQQLSELGELLTKRLRALDRMGWKYM